MHIKLDLNLHVVFTVVRELTLIFECLKMMFLLCIAAESSIVNEDSESPSSSECLWAANSSEVETSDESEKDLETNNDPVIPDDHEAIQCSSELLQKSSALFLLGLKEKNKLTQVALQGVLEGVTNFN